uniref:Uncharacterized protein n=2 Tax=Aegilops tauschii subsp. strangulata TaxID=200361 RepID=A0A453T2V4_AEGTS
MANPAPQITNSKLAPSGPWMPCRIKFCPKFLRSSVFGPVSVIISQKSQPNTSETKRVLISSHYVLHDKFVERSTLGITEREI